MLLILTDYLTVNLNMSIVLQQFSKNKFLIYIFQNKIANPTINRRRTFKPKKKISGKHFLIDILVINRSVRNL